MKTTSNQMQTISPSSVQSIHADMLKRCKNGDRHAQMQVYHLYYKAMYNTALRIVKDRFEAEDLMQESFLKAFNDLPTLHDLSTFTAWLKRIVVNKSINSLRQKATYDGFVDSLETTPEIEPEKQDLPYSVQEIKAAMEALPDGYRVVLSLYLFEGFDHEEIAEILSITSSTSRSQYNRGRNQLKQLLISKN
jgi:RNA polymerase sigma factor (sigma-70 family)